MGREPSLHPCCTPAAPLPAAAAAAASNTDLRQARLQALHHAIQAAAVGSGSGRLVLALGTQQLQGVLQLLGAASERGWCCNQPDEGVWEGPAAHSQAKQPAA